MTCRPHGQRHDGPFRDRPGRRAGPWRAGRRLMHVGGGDQGAPGPVKADDPVRRRRCPLGT